MGDGQTELGAAWRGEAEEEAREQQLYHSLAGAARAAPQRPRSHTSEHQLRRGLAGVPASISGAASPARARAALPRPRRRAHERLRHVLTSARRGRARWWLTRRGARTGSSGSGELAVKAVASLRCVPHPGVGRWTSGHGHGGRG